MPMMQSSCLKIWDGMEENKEKAQVEIVHVCVCACVFNTHTSKTTSCTPGAAEGEGAGELGGKPRKVQGRLTAVSLGIALPEELRLLDEIKDLLLRHDVCLSDVALDPFSVRFDLTLNRTQDSANRNPGCLQCPEYA